MTSLDQGLSSSEARSGKSLGTRLEHVVVSRKGPESPVYALRPETGRGRNRVLHRNLLLPCEHLPLENWSELTRKTTETHRATKRVPQNESEDERSNSEIPTMNFEILVDKLTQILLIQFS